jgi:ribosomal protein S12 methylthiotransferase accessory factor
MRPIDAPSAAPQYGEREQPLDQALSHARDAIDAYGLRAELAPLLDVADTAVWHCTLRREDGGVVAWGQGKGTAASARVGAMFEAIEHFHFGRDSIRADDIVLQSTHALAAGPLRAERAISLLGQSPDRSMGCLPYEDVSSGTPVLAPIFLSFPGYVERELDDLRRRVADTYDYYGPTSIRRYSTNSGCAAGLTPEEAAVHALNELVERDAHSLLLIDQFLTRDPAPLRVVDPATLPPDLSSLLASARHRTDGRIHLLDVTTDLGIPSFMAWMAADPGQPARVCGMGTSLSRRYAITRAITELVEMHSSHGGRAATRPADATARTAAYPALHACYLSDFSPFLGSAASVAFADTEAPLTPQGHLRRLTDILQAHGLTAYRRQHASSATIAAVSMIVPGLERFLLVTYDKAVTPGPRGLALLRARDGLVAS